MYEGAVEANDYLRQADSKNTQEYYEKFGEPQTQEDIDKFNEYKKEFRDHSLNVANAVFLSNLALVGGSQIATLPSVFGKGVNESINASRKKVFERIVDGLKEAFVPAAEKNGFAKGLQIAKNIAKPLASEGLMEEGGQNFVKNMALDYIDKHYNPDAAKNNYDLANSLGNAFQNAYMTTDG